MTVKREFYLSIFSRRIFTGACLCLGHTVMQNTLSHNVLKAFAHQEMMKAVTIFVINTVKKFAWLVGKT